MLKWKTTQWNDEAVDANRKAIKEQLQLMLREYRKVYPREDEDTDDAAARGVNAGKYASRIGGEAGRIRGGGGGAALDDRGVRS